MIKKSVITRILLSDYGFSFDVFVHGLIAPFATVAGLFVATERRVQIKIATLDVTLSCPYSPGDFQCTCFVLGINSGR